MGSCHTGRRVTRKGKAGRKKERKALLSQINGLSFTEIYDEGEEVFALCEPFNRMHARTGLSSVIHIGFKLFKRPTP